MAKKKRKKNRPLQVFPLPEILAPGDWRITEGAPMVDLLGRHMSVPLGNTETAAYMRTHEMVHVRITPAISPVEQAFRHKTSVLAIQAVEDMRVHLFMRRRKLNLPVVETAVEIEKKLREVLHKGLTAEASKKLAALLLSVSNAEAQAAAFKMALQTTVPEQDYLKIINAVRATRTLFEKSEIKQDPAGMRGLADDPAGFEALTIPTAKFFDSLFDVDDKELSDRYTSSCANVDGEWGELEPIRKPTLTHPKTVKGCGQRIWRDEGTVPVAIHRLTIDNRLFARKKKVNGGTVLVDASGSMLFKEKDLADVIEAAPGATVAVYAGDGNKGRLVVAAKNGKMAKIADVTKELTPEFEDGDYPMSGNIVDGPVLRWLAKQPAPRIWVSDGMVTGIDDHRALNLHVEAAQIVRFGDIERILDWREVVEALR